MNARVGAYMAFCAFCAVSAARDVLSEILFKDHGYSASPFFVLFVYSAVTQLVAGVALLLTRPYQVTYRLAEAPQLIWLNFFTLAAFLFYFLAIGSPLGAAANSFIDYGTSPLFTAIVGMLVVRERLDSVFAVSALLSVGGIIILSVPRVTVDQFSLLWFAGLAFSLLSSGSSAFYRVNYKVLLLGGMTKSAIIFVRLFGLTIVLGLVLLIRPELFRFDLLVQTCIVGLIGFTLPLFLTLTVMERLTIRSFAMLLFTLPVLTFLLSASFGYARFFASDVAAGALVIVSVILHERHDSNGRNGVQ